jgi:hypothetical protein
LRHARPAQRIYAQSPYPTVGNFEENPQYGEQKPENHSDNPTPRPARLPQNRPRPTTLPIRNKSKKMKNSQHKSSRIRFAERKTRLNRATSKTGSTASLYFNFFAQKEKTTPQAITRPQSDLPGYAKNS